MLIILAVVTTSATLQVAGGLDYLVQLAEKLGVRVSDDYRERVRRMYDYLFAIAQTNGTLDKITKYAVKAVRGNVAMLPIVLFFLAFGLSAMGPGQITISALLAPPAMLLAGEVGISPLLMALVVGNGAQAGAMSPIAPPGIISASLLRKMGLTDVGVILWVNMLICHVAVSILAYFLFGGLKLLRTAR